MPSKLLEFPPDDVLTDKSGTHIPRPDAASASTAPSTQDLVPTASISKDSDGKGEQDATCLLSLSRETRNMDVVAACMQSLARQLEFYFSKQNLLKDTYMQTLRGLNDGCVPVSILANFTKVKAILTPAGYTRKPAALLLQEEEVRVHSILQAVNEYTDLLRVFSIDTTTGKITTDDTPSSAITILAVGLATSELPSISSVQSLTGLDEAAATNTIILRDVDPSITVDEIMGVLGQLEDCPAVESVTRDVANCWFIALSSRDRTDGVRAMMQLRSMTFPRTGDYILARLKASVVTATPVDLYNTYPGELSAKHLSNGKKKSKKKKKKRGLKNRRNKDASNQRESTPPPSLSDDHFPSLQNDKVEWETSALDPNGLVQDEDDDQSGNGSKDEDEPKSSKAFSVSDAASTATTISSTATTSSTSEKQSVVPPYAAAVMKGIPKPDVPPSVREGSTSTGSTNSSIGNGPPTTTKEKLLGPTPVEFRSQPVWGNGRSYIDVIRHPSSGAATTDHL